MNRTHFRFYSDQFGFKYFNGMEQISDTFTKEEFQTGTLSLWFDGVYMGQIYPTEGDIISDIYK